MSEFDSVVREVPTRSFPGKELHERQAFTQAGMSPEELVRLYELVAAAHASEVLEIGLGKAFPKRRDVSALARDQDG